MSKRVALGNGGGPVTSPDRRALALGRDASKLRQAGDLDSAEVVMLAAFDVPGVSLGTCARLRRRLAVLIRDQEQYDEAIELLDTASRHYSGQGDLLAVAKVSAELSGIYLCVPDFEAAARAARAGLEDPDLPPYHYASALQNLTTALSWSARTPSQLDELRCCVAACAAPDGPDVVVDRIMGSRAAHWRSCVAGWRLTGEIRHLDRLALVRDSLASDGLARHAACASLELALLLRESGASWGDVRTAAVQFAWRGLRGSPCTTRAYAALRLVFDSLAREQLDVATVWLASSRLRQLRA